MEYDWEKMGFDPDEDDVELAFLWAKSPQGYNWWVINKFTPEGQDEFARMKRLYAEDMAAKEGPVRTVVRKEIVPGVYGAVRIHDPGSKYVRVNVDAAMDRDDLTDAIETLTQIRDAL